MGCLHIQNLKKSWPVQAVKNIQSDIFVAADVDFSVEAGEFVALLGPSGCGKSTTLRMIAGLEIPDSGRVFLDKRDITDLSPGKRELAMVFQSYALFPHLNVRDNILFGLQVRRVSKDEQRRRLNFVIELMDLGCHLEKKPGQLSGGQCQRVALARAVVSEARLCLMDEPLSNLDARLRAEMRSELRALQQRLGMTVLYVTHDQTEAMSMADRIILLNQGRIVQNGRPEELYNCPENIFAAQFIGSPPMNLLKQSDSTLGIRPEHIVPVIEETKEAVTHKAEVLFCDYLGADTLARLKVMGQNLQVRLPGHQTLQAGTQLTISWQKHQQHYFCQDTGLRISLAGERASSGSKQTTTSANNKENNHAA